MPNISPLQVPNVQQTPAVGGTPPTGNPNIQSLDPATETVEGRVAGIVNKGSPLQQLAKTQSQQRMQQKGLLNTSMAVGAGQKAVIESALPIAQSDAANAVQLRLQREKEGIDKRLLTASADEQIRLIAKKGEIDTRLQSISGQQALEQIGAKGEVETGLIVRRGEIEKELQTADSINRSRLLKEQGEVDSQLLKISGRQALDQIGARGNVDMALQRLQGSQSLAQIAASGEIESGLIGRRGEVESGLIDRRGEIEKLLQTADAKNRSMLQAEQGSIEQKLVKLRGSEDIKIRNAIGKIEKELQSADLASREGLQASQLALQEKLAENDIANRLAMQKIQGDQAVNLEKIRSQFDILISTDKNAAMLSASTNQQIAALMNNPDISPTDREAATQVLIDNLDASLALVGATGARPDIDDILGDIGGKYPTSTDSSSIGSGSGDSGFTTYAGADTAASGAASISSQPGKDFTGNQGSNPEGIPSILEIRESKSPNELFSKYQPDKSNQYKKFGYNITKDGDVLHKLSGKLADGTPFEMRFNFQNIPEPAGTPDPDAVNIPGIGLINLDKLLTLNGEKIDQSIYSDIGDDNDDDIDEGEDRPWLNDGQNDDD